MGQRDSKGTEALVLHAINPNTISDTPMVPQTPTGVILELKLGVSPEDQ